jgi:formylglycine-generating enzyme required for sulfatase activity
MANGYGLYDMIGNIWEWCWDRYHSDYYSNSPTDNPTGPATGWYRVLRGDDRFADSLFIRVAAREAETQVIRYSSIGMRVVAARH